MRRFALAAIVLAGCGGPVLFTRPGATAAEYDRDMAQCTYEGAAATATYGSGQPTARTVAGALGQGFGIGLGRAVERYDLQILCMRARGWIATRQGEMPAVHAADQAPVVPAPSPRETPQESKYLFAAQDWMRASGCQAPAATMTAKGAGFEVFTARCGAADPVVIRCEFGICRGLF